MKRIWSPWRIDYIRSPKPEGCVFCDAPRDDDDAERLILFRGQYCYIMMNRYPYNNGHLMVIPYAHVSMPNELESAAQIEMWQEVNMCLEALSERMEPDGFNVGMNLGASAGAGIVDHIHMHIVPRWIGDTNFMPVIGETNVIVEGLEDCYEQLRPALDSLCTEENPAEDQRFRPQRQGAD